MGPTNMADFAATDIEMAQLSRRRNGPVPGTVNDDGDMRRMGKRQELNRVYTHVTVMGYTVILGLTFPFSLFTGALGLQNGGPSGAIWVFLAVCVGMSTIVLSLAEMASLEPNAGGQYHWVSVFAPKKYQKFCSYMVGWMCVLGWQAALPGTANTAAANFQALGVVANSSYVSKPWQLVLITIGICGFALVFNARFSRKLPGLEGFVFMLYILAFFAIIIVLLVMGPRSAPEDVFANFQDNAGWGSIGTACFVSVSGPVVTLIGTDSAAHLAEELQDASKQLPRAMIVASGLNYIIGFVMLIVLVFVLGDVQKVLETPTGQPWVQVLWNATQSKVPVIIFTALICFFLIFTAINSSVCVSRQIFAFARDGGLPYSEWIRKVSPTQHVPTNAIILTFVIGSLMGIIPLGSSVAFLNIQSIGISGLEASYLCCILARLYNRNFSSSPYGNMSHPPPFYLGHTLGNIINIIALLFVTCFLVSACFPPVPNPSPEAMTWSSAALGGTVIIALVAYAVRGDKYQGAGTKPFVDEIATPVEVHVEGKK